MPPGAADAATTRLRLREYAGMPTPAESSVDDLYDDAGSVFWFYVRDW